jgi:mono/diheme cytochrome c family protein
MNLRKDFYLLFIFIALFMTRSWAQNWVAPEEAKGVVSPFRFTADSIKKGEAIFLKNCTSCHGNPGKANWAKITPPPGDPAADKFQNQKDGELFFKITTGKIPMPEFRNILGENERWNVIAYIRSFNPSYVQPNPALKAGFTGKVVELELVYKQEANKILVRAMEITKEKTQLPVKGAEILLFLKRYFGNMAVGDPKTTNDKGEAYFDFPKDLPSDLKGGLDLMAMVNDRSGSLSDTRINVRLETGNLSTPPPLTETRAWWSTRDQAPIWLILTYTFSVLIVWGFIFYILYSVLQIRKIRE